MSRILAGRFRWRIGRSMVAGSAPGWGAGASWRGRAPPRVTGGLPVAGGPEELLQEATPDPDQSGLLGGSQRRPEGWDIGGRIESNAGREGRGGTLRRRACRMGALLDRVADSAGTNRPR